MKKVLEKMIFEFKKIFGDTNNIQFYFAPGRINLIGEHIDYNGGHVFPYAINRGTFIVAKKRSDLQMKFYSLNIKTNPRIYETVVGDSEYVTSDPWSNYPKGVIHYIQEAGYKITSGFNVLFYGNIPGSGLSSSASLEVATATMINDLFSLNIDKKEIALICKKVENEFIHVNSGIMDQFASAFGLKNHAIYLDCHTLNYEYAPINFPKYALIATNSNVNHSLSSSKYNERRKECNIALEQIRKEKDIKNLCELSVDEFNSLSHLIDDEIVRKRAFYVVKEEDRVNRLVQALSQNNLDIFAQLINESGDGLKLEYEATCPEIDFLVDKARSIKGCIASRMTGGGWGGNIISIVEKNEAKKFMDELQVAYKKETNKYCRSSILPCSDGARRIEDDLF